MSGYDKNFYKSPKKKKQKSPKKYLKPEIKSIHESNMLNSGNKYSYDPTAGYDFEVCPRLLSKSPEKGSLKGSRRGSGEKRSHRTSNRSGGGNSVQLLGEFYLYGKEDNNGKDVYRSIYDENSELKDELKLTHERNRSLEGEISRLHIERSQLEMRVVELHASNMASFNKHSPIQKVIESGTSNHKECAKNLDMGSMTLSNEKTGKKQ